MGRSVAVLATTFILIACAVGPKQNPLEHARSGTAGISIGFVIGLMSPEEQGNKNDERSWPVVKRAP